MSQKLLDAIAKRESKLTSRKGGKSAKKTVAKKAPVETPEAPADAQGS